MIPFSSEYQGAYASFCDQLISNGAAPNDAQIAAAGLAAEHHGGSRTDTQAVAIARCHQQILADNSRGSGR